MFVTDTLTLFAVAFLALLLAGALAPLETLGWWAGWFGQSARDPGPVAPMPELVPPSADAYVVFLSGIHNVEMRSFARREVTLLASLRERLPDHRVLEVFPYSVTNRALTGQRAFAGYWRWALRMKLSQRSLANMAGMVINLRNLWQVAVSADRRYGPMYSYGSATLIAEALLAEGYRPGSGKPLTLIGYSGGGQVAAGAAGHLKVLLGVAVTVVSLGGVLASDPGMLEVRHLYHLYGSRDRVQRLGLVFFAGRWPLLQYSPWNQARAKGLVSFVELGPMQHTGRSGYLSASETLADGRTFLQATLDALCTGILAHAASAGAALPAEGLTGEVLTGERLADERRANQGLARESNADEGIADEDVDPPGGKLTP